MPSTSGGITQPGPEEAVNTAAGFEAAMAAKGVEREEGDSGSADTDIASGLTYARDEQGRFVSPPPVEEEPEGDDPLAAYIATQHGGDAEAALAALYKENQNQSSLLGRQAQEVGDTRAMREELAELRGQLTAITSMAASPPLQVSGEQAEEYAAEMINRLGYREAATQAANIAHDSGDDTVYSKVIEAWNMDEPYQALTHVADFRAWARDEAAAAARPPTEPDAWVEEQKGIQALTGPLERLSKEMGPERWAVVAPQMEAALEALPQGVAELVVSDDPETSLQGLQIVGERAYLMGLAENQKAEQRAQRKMAGAGVATSSLRPPRVTSTGDITPDQIEAAKQRFKAAIMETETTDVRSGLTYGAPLGQAAPQR